MYQSSFMNTCMSSNGGIIIYHLLILSVFFVTPAVGFALQQLNVNNPSRSARIRRIHRNVHVHNDDSKVLMSVSSSKSTIIIATSLFMSSSNNFSSKPPPQFPIETKKIKLSEVLAEIKTCKPSKNSNSIGIGNFEPLLNLFQSSPSKQKNKNNKPPLLFIHGSFHASWCWAEHYMPYFASLGYPCYALSLRGTGGTFAGEGVKKVKMEEHVRDITDCLSYIIGECEGQGQGQGQGQDNSVSRKPVLIAHSFGGLATMKYLEENLMGGSITSNDLLVSGVASLCSVPPSGNGKMTMRFLKRSLVDSWKITAGLAMKKCITDKNLCRELFFDGVNVNANADVNADVNVNDDGSTLISDADLERIQGYFERDTVATIDLVDLSKKLPSVHVDENGKAMYLSANSRSSSQLPAIVIGAKDDFIVDEEGVRETARYYGVDPVFVESPHDIMLGTRWENGANALKRWLDEFV